MSGYRNRCEMVATLAYNLRPEPTACEVGVFHGHYSEVIYEALSPSFYVMVDLWGAKPNPEYDEFTKKERAFWERMYKRVSDKFGSRPGVQIIRDFSTEAAKLFEPGRFDFVYLDANHSYQPVLDDLRAWWPLVATGGVMAGHDYLWGRTKSGAREVKLAVDTFFESVGAVVELTTEKYPSWFVRK